MRFQVLNINELRVNIDYTVERNLKPFKQEVLDQLYTHHTLNKDMSLLFSGGMDSTFILRSLLELDIKPDLYTLSFSQRHDDYECELAKRRCKQYGLPSPNFVYVDQSTIVDYSLYLINDCNIGYPFLHGYYIHYLLNEYKTEKFYCGMGSEYKLYDNVIKLMLGPQMVKQYNPDRLFEFTSSRTFLSYINHPSFLANYKKPVPDNYRKDLYARDQIYTNCYPDIFVEHKRGPDDTHVNDFFKKNIFPLIKDKMPWLPITTNYYFNVDEYLNRKKKI